MPDAEQRLVAVRAVHGLLTEGTREARSLALAHLLDVLADVYDDDPATGFFGWLAAEFQVPDLPVSLVAAGVGHAVAATLTMQQVADGEQGGGRAPCGGTTEHKPHTLGVDHCDGRLRRRKPPRQASS